MCHYFLGLSFEEFVVWLRTGSHKLYPKRLVVSNQSDLEYPLYGPLAESILKAIPSHESIGGVVIVQLKNVPTELIDNRTFSILDSRHINTVFALSERDQRFLQQQLGNSYLLSKQLLLRENRIEQWIKNLAVADAQRGGHALIEVVCGTDKPARRLEREQWSQIVLALQKRDEGTRDFASAQGDLMRCLFFYTRSNANSKKPISKEDIGFFEDMVYILTNFDPTVKPFGYGSEIKTLQKEFQKARLSDLYKKIDSGRIPEFFDFNLRHPGGLLASLVFLKLMYIIRETERLTRDDLITTLGEFKDPRFHLPIIEGAWWCGVFWGFSRFHALFHNAIHHQLSPILPESTVESVTDETQSDSLPELPEISLSIGTKGLVGGEITFRVSDESFSTAENPPESFTLQPDKAEDKPLESGGVLFREPECKESSFSDQFMQKQLFESGDPPNQD